MNKVRERGWRRGEGRGQRRETSPREESRRDNEDHRRGEWRRGHEEGRDRGRRGRSQRPFEDRRTNREWEPRGGDNAQWKHCRKDSFPSQESSWSHSSAPQKHSKAAPSAWQQVESSHYDLKYTSVSKSVQTEVAINSSSRCQLEAVSLSKAFPRLLEAVSEQFRRWPKDKSRLKEVNSAETALDQLTHIVKTTIWKLAIALDQYFIDHCNGIDQAQPWELVKNSKSGDFVHFILHKEDKTVYALDILQWRSEDWPYGLRICSLDKHTK